MDIGGAPGGGRQGRRAIAQQRSPATRSSKCAKPRHRHARARITARNVRGLERALADVPPDRVAGAILITDGEVHDVPRASCAIEAPFHALIVGRRNERDRKLTVVSATRYAIVGQKRGHGGAGRRFRSPRGRQRRRRRARRRPCARARRSCRRAATRISRFRSAMTARTSSSCRAKPGPAELTLQNNRAVVVVNGVRDRLRVLLISGEPHAGERVWRNLLKADPSVDLVHFTILRPPEKQAEDPTPHQRIVADRLPDAGIVRRETRQFRSGDLRPLQRARHPAARPISRISRDYVREWRRAAGVGAARNSPGPRASSARRSPSVLPAQPTGEIVTQRLQADGHAARPRPSGDARSAGRQHRRKSRRAGAAGSASSAPTRSPARR